MSKYAPLGRHLASRTDETWRTTFPEIEKLLGFTLPDSARKHPAWWANDQQGIRASVWLEAGWRTEELSIASEKVVFRRDGIPTMRPTPKAESAPFVPIPLSEPVEMHLRMSWTTLGAIATDGNGKLVFPVAPHSPAIYRFTIRMAGKERRYVGEAVDVARRFQNYRTPGPTQQTSQRINEILTAAMGVGAEITVAAVLPDAALFNQNGTQRSADLNSKVIRCLFENAAILDGGGEEVESLNMAK